MPHKARSLRKQRGDVTLFMLMAIMLSFLAIAMGLSDDVNRRMRFALTDDQTAYIQMLTGRLKDAYGNLLRSRGNASYTAQPVYILDNPGTISAAQLLSALGEPNPKYNVQAYVSDLKTYSPCTDTTSCTGVTGLLTYRKIYLWIPPESGIDTSGVNASGQWTPDPMVSLWETVDGSIIQSEIYGTTQHAYDRLTQWVQQYFAARQLTGGGVTTNRFRATDCADSLSQTGLPCMDSATIATAAFLQATGLTASDLVDGWGFPIQISNTSTASVLNLTSTQTQTNGQAFTVTRQILSP